VDNWFLKERFGWADYRLHSIEAISNWQALVFAAYVFSQFQRVQPLLTNPKAQLQPLGETLTDHQTWHFGPTLSCSKPCFQPKSFSFGSLFLFTLCFG